MRQRALVVLALAVCALSISASSEDRVTAEIARVERFLTALDPATVSELVRELVPAYRARIETARKAETPHLRLYRLRSPFLGSAMLGYLDEYKAAAENLAAFEAHWNAQRPRFTNLKPRGASAFHKALAEAAINRSEKLFNAALAYAKVDTPQSGLYYVAEARANLDFANFVASLDGGQSLRLSVDPGSLRGTADALEKEALALFEKDPASRASIPVSARLKEARELLDRGSNHGAALGLAETRLELKRQSGDANAPGPANDQELAQFINASSSPSTLPARKAAQVRVALIRWPYT